jgi:rRNA-processing protein FCF1
MSKDIKQKVSVAIPESVIKEVKRRSEKENRSFSNMITVLVTEGLKTKAA